MNDSTHLLDVIKKLDSATFKALMLATAPLLVAIAALFGVDEAVFKSQIESWVEKLALILTLAGVAWATWARLFQPTPPLTETARVRTLEALETGKITATPVTPPSADPSAPPTPSGGFVRVSHLILVAIAATMCLSVISVAGCTHTRAAIEQADSPSDYALLILEGYANALSTINRLRDSGALSTSDIERAQAAELKAAPFVDKIDPLRQAFERTRSAEDEIALQKAIDDAIKEAADFIRLVRELRGGNSQ